MSKGVVCKMTQRYETGISENNLKHWGPVEVVKEFMQNNVYAKAILGDEATIQYDGKYAIMENREHGFTKGKLLLGESEQVDVAGAPGQYGEGMKVAMAVARRLNRECLVITNGFNVRPELEPSSLDSSVRALIFYIDDNDVTWGTCFKIECTKEEYEEALSYFAVLNGVDMELTKKNAIIDDVEDTVFVNGVKIAETNSIQSYNFVSPELMNRDRSSVDMGKVKVHVSRILGQINDVGLAGAILKCIIDDDTLLEAQSGIDQYVKEFSSEVWLKAKHITFGDRVALATGTDADTRARYKKFNVIAQVPSQWKWFFRAYLDIYPTSEIDELANRPKNVHIKSSIDENNILGWAKRLIRLYYADYGTIRVSEHVYDNFGNECDGLYIPGTDITWIKRSVLSSKEKTFKTLLHETIHRKTGASDNSIDFTRAWEDASWAILNRGKICEM